MSMCNRMEVEITNGRVGARGTLLLWYGLSETVGIHALS